MDDLASPEPDNGAESKTAEVQIELKPPIDSLQPTELFKRVDHIIAEMRQCKDESKMGDLKTELLEALHRLKLVKLALKNLQNLYKRREEGSGIPENQNPNYDPDSTQSDLKANDNNEESEDFYYKNPITKFPNLRAAENALREQSFFAEHVSYFAMLLIEMNNFKNIKQELTPTERDYFYKQVITTIDYGLPHKHLLFSHGERIIAIVSVDDDSELMQVGQDIMSLISDQNFEVYNKLASTTLSIGAASLATEMKDENKKFDFKLWLKKCEAGLHKAKSLNEQNGTMESRCCIGKGDDTSAISAISTVSGDAASVKKHKSQFSLLASAASGPSGSSGDTMSALLGGAIGGAMGSSNNSDLNRMMSLADSSITGDKPNYNATLNPTQLHASIRLYDKIQRLTNKNANIVAISLTNRFMKQGANFNFQNPRDKRNTLLMLCCNKNLDILIKFICEKIGSNKMDFNVKNDDSYNALMLAVLHVTDDNTVAMIAKCTTDKNAITNGGKTAKDLATENSRTGILDIL